MAPATIRMIDLATHRMIGARADMTPQNARIAATRLGDAPRPLRLSYAGQVLRVTGSEIRPERQIGQVGAELIGAAGADADVEAIAVAGEALAAIGVPELSVDITLPSLVPAVAEAYGIAGERAAALRSALDHKDAAAAAAVAGEAGRRRGCVSAAAAIRPAIRRNPNRRPGSRCTPTRSCEHCRPPHRLDACCCRSAPIAPPAARCVRLAGSPSPPSAQPMIGAPRRTASAAAMCL